MSARLEQLQKITEKASLHFATLQRIANERKIKEEIEKENKRVEDLKNKITEKAAYIEMMIFDAASKGRNEYSYNFGKDPDLELVIAICKKFDDLRQCKSFKKESICLNYDTDKWMEYDAEIVTFYWS